MDYFFTWRSLQQLILVLIDINGITDFTKSRCNNIKWLLRAPGTIQPNVLSCIVGWAAPPVWLPTRLYCEVSPAPSQLYVKHTVGGESNTIRHLLPHTIYGAACSITTCSFCAQPQYQTPLSIFFCATAPSHNCEVKILVER